MKTYITIVLFLFYSFIGFSQVTDTKINVGNNIEAIKLSDKVYLYIATSYIEGFGMVPSNGLILVDKGKAFLIDTPMSNEQTETLVNWISGYLRATITDFIPTHWHADCIGGLGYLQSKGVRSYANQMTIDIAKEKGIPLPDKGFKDSLDLKLNNIKLQCYYPGGGHSTDNIVVWIPSEKILFGGCLIKDAAATSLGNTSDADLEAWPRTVKKVLDKYPSAKIVIPGHGQLGGLNIIRHTYDIVSPKNK